MFGIGLQQKLFQSRKNICYDAIQNGRKSNSELQISTEGCQKDLEADKYKACEIYRICDPYEKMFTNALRLSKKIQLIEWKHTDTAIKKMFRAQLSVKKVMFADFKVMKVCLTTNFQEKCATVKSAYYF